LDELKSKPGGLYLDVPNPNYDPFAWKKSVIKCGAAAAVAAAAVDHEKPNVTLPLDTTPLTTTLSRRI
jgi:UDP-N-acetylmuramyl pentapeptide synthase